MLITIELTENELKESGLSNEDLAMELFTVFYDSEFSPYQPDDAELTVLVVEDDCQFGTAH